MIKRLDITIGPAPQWQRSGQSALCCCCGAPLSQKLYPQYIWHLCLDASQTAHPCSSMSVVRSVKIVTHSMGSPSAGVVPQKSFPTPYQALQTGCYRVSYGPWIFCEPCAGDRSNTSCRSSSDVAREHDGICNRAHPEVPAGWASGKVIVMSVPCSNASYASGFSQPPSKKADPPADTLLPKQTQLSLKFDTVLLTHTVYLCQI